MIAKLCFMTKFMTDLTLNICKFAMTPYMATIATMAATKETPATTSSGIVVIVTGIIRNLS